MSEIETVREKLNRLLADCFALFIKSKNFHWHVTGPMFPEYHALFDEQSSQIMAMTDTIAERVRKLRGVTIHSIGEIASLSGIKDNDSHFVKPDDMMALLAEDNKALLRQLNECHDECAKYGDVATTAQIEIWLDETQKRVWFLEMICLGIEG